MHAPATIERWHQVVKDRDVRALHELLAEDVVFVSPVVLGFGYVVSLGPVGFFSVWFQDIFGSVAEAQKSGQVKEPATSLHRVNKAKSTVDQCEIGGFLFPLHQLRRQFLQRLAGFGNEFLKKIVHRVRAQPSLREIRFRSIWPPPS